MPGLGSFLLEFAAGSAAEFHQGVGLDHQPPAGGERRFEHSRGLQGKAREKNVGWRIDYFLITEELKKNLADSKILSDVMGSDHCPVELILNFSEENA